MSVSPSGPTRPVKTTSPGLKTLLETGKGLDEEQTASTPVREAETDGLARRAVGHLQVRAERPGTSGRPRRACPEARAGRRAARRLLPGWIATCNVERTHAALGGITPMAPLVNNLHRNHS
jgi:hypothetical protein